MSSREWQFIPVCSRTATKWLASSFTYSRDIELWDFETVRSLLISVIRNLGYRGHVAIWRHDRVSHITVYSPSIFNWLRTNPYVWWFCVILQLWIITWPILILLTHRYQTITSFWSTKANVPDEDLNTTRTIHSGPYSDERNLVRYITPALRDAVYARSVGCILINTNAANRAQNATRDAQNFLGTVDSPVPAFGADLSWRDAQRMRRARGSGRNVNVGWGASR